MKLSSLLTGLLMTLPIMVIGAEEKKLNIYQWADYFAPETLEKFEKETGIKVQYDAYDSCRVPYDCAVVL